jgi:hypothetical protein
MMKSRRMIWAGHAGCMGQRACFRILEGKPEEMKPSHRCKHRWEADLREIGCGDMNWTDLAQDMDQWMGYCEHGNEHSGSIKCLEILEHLSNWWLLKKDSAP